MADLFEDEMDIVLKAGEAAQQRFVLMIYRVQRLLRSFRAAFEFNSSRISLYMLLARSCSLCNGVSVPADLVCSRQGFSNRQAGRANGPTNAGQQRSQNSSPTTVTPTTPSADTPVSFPANPGANVEDNTNNSGEPLAPEPTKWFFKEAYAKLSVKGNFIPLAAKPTYLDLGDWLAHASKYMCSRCWQPVFMKACLLMIACSCRAISAHGAIPEGRSRGEWPHRHADLQSD